MLFHVTWQFRDSTEDGSRRSLEVFSKWQPPAGAGIKGFFGFAVGTLIRNQVGAIVALLAYAFTVDAVLFSAVPSIGRYLPGKAGDALIGRPVGHLLAPGLGAAVLVAWTLAFVAAAMVRNDHVDI